MATIAIIDTETTSLRPDRLAWEVAYAISVDGAKPTLHQHFIAVPTDGADEVALRIGRYYERHPRPFGDATNSRTPQTARSEAAVAAVLARDLHGAILAGSNPSFDDYTLRAMLARHGFAPTWNYRSIDVITLAAGWLMAAEPEPAKPDERLRLPWKSDEISAMLGIEPDEEKRHTAAGDVDWAMRVFMRIGGRGLL